MATDKQASSVVRTRDTLMDTVRAGCAAWASLYRLAAPAGCGFLGLIGIIVIFVVACPSRMIAIGTLLLLAYAVTLYFGSGWPNASLALAVGLLTLFTVDWNGANSLAFLVALSVFTVFAILTGSVRLAAQMQDILTEAAVRADPARVEDAKSAMETIAKDTSVGTVGVLERAECLRYLAYRKVAVDQMAPMLRSVCTLATVTKVPYMEVAEFVALLYLSVAGTDPDAVACAVDELMAILQNAPVTPSEFFAAFRATRHVLLYGRPNLAAYISALREGLAVATPTDVLRDRIERGFRVPRA